MDIKGIFAPQGINVVVMMVMRRSRSFSMVRDAIIPGTPHPVPISMGIKLFPDNPKRLNTRSSTKATLAMYPLSSSMERKKKSVTTIEGNTSASGTGIVANGGAVAKKVRNVNAYTLFGHPAYNDGASDKTSDKTSASDKTEAAKHYDRKEAGTYYVCTKSDPLMMRTGAGTNRKIIVRVPKGGKVQCYGYYNLDKDGVTKWLYCVYSNHRGYLCRTYLRRVQA